MIETVKNASPYLVMLKQCSMHATGPSAPWMLQKQELQTKTPPQHIWLRSNQTMRSHPHYHQPVEDLEFSPQKHLEPNTNPSNHSLDPKNRTRQLATSHFHPVTHVSRYESTGHTELRPRRNSKYKTVNMSTRGGIIQPRQAWRARSRDAPTRSPSSPTLRILAATTVGWWSSTYTLRVRNLSIIASTASHTYGARVTHALKTILLSRSLDLSLAKLLTVMCELRNQRKEFFEWYQRCAAVIPSMRYRQEWHEAAGQGLRRSVVG